MKTLNNNKPRVFELVALNMCQADIARELGISRQRVGQIIDYDRHSARQKVAYAIRRGVLQRPEVCDYCNKPAKIEAHHDDYSKPLEVRWLCKYHHICAHPELRAANTKYVFE